MAFDAAPARPSRDDAWSAHVTVLRRLIQHYAARAHLTPAEMIEVERLAEGLCCKDSAARGTISPETIRARRKRLYHKLGVAGRNEVIAGLLAQSLRNLASSEHRMPIPGDAQAPATGG